LLTLKRARDKGHEWLMLFGIEADQPLCFLWTPLCFCQVTLCFYTITLCLPLCLPLCIANIIANDPSVYRT
jgi:hypothetical protein